MNYRILTVFMGLCIKLSIFAQANLQWEAIDSRPIPEWFVQAKFGIFIHWGVYSVPSFRQVSKKPYETYAEWYEAKVMHDGGIGEAFHQKSYGKGFEYRQFAPMFKAELWNPDYWADLFVKSGARYVVLTSKHHDGYCLWDTKNNYSANWNSVQTGPKRDLLGELSKSVRNKGLKMGIYYSLMEWESTPRNHEWSGGFTGYYLPDSIINKYKIAEDKYVDDHVMPHLKELVLNYQPSVIFADGEWDKPDNYWQSKKFLTWLYANAPNKNEVVVNDRWGSNTRGMHGGYYTSEYKSDNDEINTEHSWEESRGIGQSYGYNRCENIEDYSTTSQIINELIDIVSRGGNLLLDIGPASDGTIPVIMQERLLEIGEWLKVNGDAVYGTTSLPKSLNIKVDNAANNYFTAKVKTIYLFCEKWPQNLTVSGIKNISKLKVSLLGYNKQILFKEFNSKLVITSPILTIDQMPCKHAYVFKLENAL